MKNLSTRQAAKKLGLSHGTLNNYIASGKVPAPKSVTTGTTTVHIWSEEEIENVRQLLPKIANGRKTRYQKQRQKKQRKKKSKP
jgi:predicted DNA-binding transcriptional regulator AlpA